MGDLTMKHLTTRLFINKIINKSFNSGSISLNPNQTRKRINLNSATLPMQSNSQSSNKVRGFSGKLLAILSPILGLAVSFSMAGCGQTNQPTTSQSIEPKKTVQESLPTYVMAVGTYDPPFAFKDETGSIVGFDIDLMNAIATHAHFNVSVLEIPWKDAFDNLQAGKFKILGSGVGITPKREEIADFSNSYMDSHISFAYKNAEIKSLKDIKDRSIGIQPEVFYVDQLDKSYSKNNQLTEYKTTFLACKDMINAKIDLCIDDIHVLRHMEKQLPDQEQAQKIKHLDAFKDSTKSLAFAVQKGDTEMAAIINQGLADTVADGTYEKLYTKWFGSADASNTSATKNTPKTDTPKT